MGTGEADGARVDDLRSASETCNTTCKSQADGEAEVVLGGMSESLLQVRFCPV